MSSSSGPYQRYSTSAVAIFNDMWNLSNTTTQVFNWTLPQRTNDTIYGKDMNATYWMLEVPYTVGGLCNGTIEFTAIIAS